MSFSGLSKDFGEGDQKESATTSGPVTEEEEATDAFLNFSYRHLPNLQDLTKEALLNKYPKLREFLHLTCHRSPVPPKKQ